jgi:hypothetical protein
MTITKADEELLKKYAEQVAKFRKFCIECGDSVTFAEVNFYDLSIGFFVALGIDGDSGTGEQFYDAGRLAVICRYHLQYWEGETI